MTVRRPAHDNAPLENGWALLKEGDWERARQVFQSVSEGAPTAECLEGLSWAAWWLDDVEALFDARKRAFHLYREARDLRSAARMATWLAADEVDFRGALAVANGWLERAHRLLADLEPGSDHGWLAFLEGYIANLRGEADRARQLGERAVELGERYGVSDLQMLGLALQGATLVQRGQIAAGMRQLDAATTMALEGEATIPISGAWACCFLVTACNKVFDYERAAEWCERIQEFSERYRSHYMLAYCSAEYAGVHLWRGRFQEAERSLETSLTSAKRSRQPLVGMPLVLLAELRRRQGRLEECTRLLDQAGASNASHLCQARLALDRGKPTEARAAVERLLRQLPEHKELDRAPMLELLGRACLAEQDRQAAALAFQELSALEKRVGTRALRAYADRAAGMLEAARGQLDQAILLLEDAVHGFEVCQARYEVAQTLGELATTLESAGQPGRARREAARARDYSLEFNTSLNQPTRAKSDTAVAGAPGTAAGGVSLPAETSLTARQREVLRLIAGGLTNRGIAQELGVSEHTVHRHVANILTKLDLPSRTAAASFALRHGWFTDEGGPN